MSAIKIIKQNELNIPIGTILHFTSFFDRPKFSDQNTWDSLGVYNYCDLCGNVFVIKESEIYPKIKDCYINVIALSWKRKFLFEGDVYWKVFTEERLANTCKLEFNNGKHTSALLFKPYKDVVQSNTNYMTNNVQRFETEFEANEYCKLHKNK